jgi:hypothetical protein
MDSYEEDLSEEINSDDENLNYDFLEKEEDIEKAIWYLQREIERGE